MTGRDRPGGTYQYDQIVHWADGSTSHKSWTELLTSAEATEQMGALPKSATPATHRDLPVPDEALDAWVRWTRDPLARVPTIENMTAAARAIASPVVAAVLSDIADRMDADGMGEAAGWLRVRAGEYGSAG